MVRSPVLDALISTLTSPLSGRAAISEKFIPFTQIMQLSTGAIE